MRQHRGSAVLSCYTALSWTGMVARFGDSAPFFIGESRTFRSGLAGRLYLGVNDNYFDDNTGEFHVTVDID